MNINALSKETPTADSLLEIFAMLPQWLQAIILYWLVIYALIISSIIIYGLLRLFESAWNRGLKRVSRWLPIKGSIYCARLVAQGEVFFTKAKALTGIGYGYQSENRRDSSLTALRRQPEFWVANLIVILAGSLALVVKIIFSMLQLQIINIIIWIGILWYVGYLPFVIDWILQLNLGTIFAGISPSQVGAFLGLIVIFSAVVVKSDVRGRTEFNKIASVECRKILNLIQPHVKNLYDLEVKHQNNILSAIAQFPSDEYLIEATGHHGLRWANGRLDAEAGCKDACHPNLHAKKGYVPAYRLSHWRPPHPLVQSEVKEHLEFIKGKFQELDKLGYSYKLLSVIPRGSFEASYGFQFTTDWIYDTKLHTIEHIESELAPHKSRLGQKVYRSWSVPASSSNQKELINLVEKLIGRTAAKARGELWDSFVAAERLRRLDIAIIKSRRDRIIDRIKQ